MYASEELLRWAGRLCLLLVAAAGVLGYYYANVRFIPMMAGFAILAAVCYAPRASSPEAPPFRHSGERPAI